LAEEDREAEAQIFEVLPADITGCSCSPPFPLTDRMRMRFGAQPESGVSGKVTDSGRRGPSASQQVRQRRRAALSISFRHLRTSDGAMRPSKYVPFPLRSPIKGARSLSEITGQAIDAIQHCASCVSSTWDVS
jgi:hypothetical protein